MPIARSLFFEIRGYIADAVLNRSVEYVRVGSYSRTSVVDQVVTVPLNNAYTFTGVENNTLTMVKSRLPVDITVVTPEGTLMLPQQRLMILNCPITSMSLLNSDAETPPNTADTDVHILHT